MKDIVIEFQTPEDERELPEYLSCEVHVTKNDGSFGAYNEFGELIVIEQHAYDAEVITAHVNDACFLARLTQKEVCGIEQEAIDYCLSRRD